VSQQQYPPPPPPPPAGVPGQTNGLALAGMICGIVGIVMAILIAFIGIILGILAIIFAAIGRQRAVATGVGLGQANAGLITGGVAIVTGIINIALAVALYT
jgi:hypothetical protein